MEAELSVTLNEILVLSSVRLNDVLVPLDTSL